MRGARKMDAYGEDEVGHVSVPGDDLEAGDGVGVADDVRDAGGAVLLHPRDVVGVGGGSHGRDGGSAGAAEPVTAAHKGREGMAGGEGAVVERGRRETKPMRLKSLNGPARPTLPLVLQQAHYCTPPPPRQGYPPEVASFPF
jgi:hypothetical protein